MGTKINQKEYLKKYLSGDVGEKKKKKKKRPVVGQTVRIIDDDVDVSKMQHFQDNDDLEMLTTGEDAPQVVGVIDERPPELRALDFKNSTKWKVISDDNGYESSLTVQQLDRQSGRVESSHTSKSSEKRETSKKKYESPDLSPVRKRNSSPDLSPPRRRGSVDLSPKRRGRHTPELPLARKDRKRSEDLSPPRRDRGRKDSEHRRDNRNLSPSRRREHSRGHHTPDLSPRRHSYKRRQSPDLSPPRKRFSPRPSTSRRRPSLDLSPKRRRERKSSRSPDLSPKRRKRTSSHDSPDRSKMKKTLEGKTAGLQDAKSLRTESEKIRKRDAEAFSKMSDEMSGRNATAVVRDRRTGRIRDLEAEAEKDRVKERKEQEKKAVYDRWGKGLKQVEDYRQRIDEESYEMTKPLARYSDDADLDNYLKQQEREGDPMLEYIRQKEREKQTDSKKPTVPVYKGPYPENRFSIRPGYRWDGVDRSNGYERKWFDVQNKKKAIQEEAYRYSTEDL